MKKIIILLTLIVSTLIYLEIKNNEVVIPDSAIRLRVIPNSNTSVDQNIKNKVKKYLEENTYTLLEEASDLKEARTLINANIENLDNDIGNIFKENNYDIVVCGNYNVSEDYQNKNIDAFINNYNTDLENIFFGKMAVWNKIYKRDILIKNKLEFKEKVWYEDLAFTLKAIMNSNTFAFIDEPLYDYLIREGSTMNNSNVKRNLEILEAFNDILSYIQHNKKEEYFSKIEFLAIDHIYISAIVRVLKAEADDKVKRETINKLIDYMNKKFPNYKNNKYINTLSKNRKIIYKLINIKMYGLINLIFKVKKG